MPHRPDATPLPPTDPGDTPIAPLVAGFYAEAPPAVRLGLLRAMLQPVGPLALVAIAAGAFARLLPATRWSGAEVPPEAARWISADHVLELTLYVEQKSPEWLLQLPDLMGDSRLLLGTLSGSLLWLALRSLRQRRRDDGPGVDTPIEPA